MLGIRRGDDSFVVEESGEHKTPEFAAPAEVKPADDTLSSDNAVNLDQGDPLAEADFHMAYGLYDQAADLVRIALEREPERRDLRLKLLEIYFVWGNKDAFLQTAKQLESTRDRAAPGEWDKIVIMGKQICPDEPMFTNSTGGGRGAAALVDLNLEGGENRVDIDLFGDPEGERSSLDLPLANEQDTVATGESPDLTSAPPLDFMLDAPERGADESPTREMPPRDEPTVESELMPFMDSPTQESPTLVNLAASQAPSARDRMAARLREPGAEATAEVAIDDLGLDLSGLDDSTGTVGDLESLHETDHNADAPGDEPTDVPIEAPTVVAGLDEHSRRMITETESRPQEGDMTQLERELEASFISELDASHDDLKEMIGGPESAPTMQMPQVPRDSDIGATSRLVNSSFTDTQNLERLDPESTSKLRGLNVDSIDLDLDRLATALGNGVDTVEQPRAAEELFSSEVFEAPEDPRSVDLDVGDDMNGAAAATMTTKLASNGSSKSIDVDDVPEFEPVTMSEVGTKLDLARAYMDMGDPEGARNILDEVVQEGSASQKQEAQRLIQSLPG
jgi:pilus assembly protein FimV